jgi:Fic family protein
MAFIKERTVKGKKYYALVESIKKNGKPLHKTLASLGSRKPRKIELEILQSNLKNKDKLTIDMPQLDTEQKKRADKLNKEMKTQLLGYSKIELMNFIKKFDVDFCYNTNSIEGSTVTHEEVGFIAEHKQSVEGRSLKEIHETENMLEALEFSRKYKGKINEKLIKKLHSIVQKNIEVETLGQYKRIPNYIIGVDYWPTHPALVNERMRGLVNWYAFNKTKFHPIELASIFHLKFVMIHPLTDGNGRVARLLFNLILQVHRYHPIIFSVDNKRTYYSVIKNAEQGTYKPFLEYIIKQFIRTYEGY